MHNNRSQHFSPLFCWQTSECCGGCKPSIFIRKKYERQIRVTIFNNNFCCFCCCYNACI